MRKLFCPIRYLMPGLIAAVILLDGTAAKALDSLSFTVTNAGKDFTAEIKAASRLRAAKAEKNTDPQDLFADARAEYGRLLAALYALGYYSAVIHVRIDGQEAADIAPLDAPSQISKIDVTVDPGPLFTFSRATVAPLSGRLRLPPGFVIGKPAESGLIQAAVAAGVDGWRMLGHAKAAPVAQDLVADHATSQLSAAVTLDPGPKLRFGPLTVIGEDRMREDRIRWIAGPPRGEVFDPADLDRVAARLRRTGVFQSVTITEDDQITSPDSLGINATVVEAKRKRYEFGAEIASLDGATISGSWLHRNLLGGGERLLITGEIANIGTDSSGVDYALGVSLERPATPGPDTTARLNVEVSRVDEADYNADLATAGLAFSHVFSDQLSAHVGMAYEYTQGADLAGAFLYQRLTLPLGTLWDNRNSRSDATGGVYLGAEVKPFLGFGTTDNGARVMLDARGYRPLDAGRRFVVAGRLQAGAVLGASLLGAPRDDLFYSGGGGTVRGQPYQSLGVTIVDGGTAIEVGGTHFLGASLEARMKITDRIGAVGFFDAGQIGVGGFAAGDGGWHSGAGVGARYETGFGPIRLDVAAPLHGDTGSGVQIYLGLGQSF